MTSAGDARQVAAQRLTACEQLFVSSKQWLGSVPTPQGRPWLEQREIELSVRSILTMHCVVLLGYHRLWAPASALARMLLEDAAVAYWLTDHPDLDRLTTRWTEHLDASRFADFKAQQELGLDIDKTAQAWHATHDPRYLEEVAKRHRNGSAHWTGRSVAELVAGTLGRGASTREDWPERIRLLELTQLRMFMPVSLSLHHSPSTTQNWYADPDEMLADPLRVAWIAFGLHTRLALDYFVPEHTHDARDLIYRQAPSFLTRDDDCADDVTAHPHAGPRP